VLTNVLLILTDVFLHFCSLDYAQVGFPGLACRYCGGRPSFGRYFPNSVRSFAQTTSSQTIISHVTQYCQECPADIREWIIRMQKREGKSSVSSSYGSRKVFFENVWARMHPPEKDVIADAAATAVGGGDGHAKADAADDEQKVDDDAKPDGDVGGETEKSHDMEQEAASAESNGKKRTIDDVKEEEEKVETTTQSATPTKDDSSSPPPKLPRVAAV